MTPFIVRPRNVMNALVWLVALGWFPIPPLSAQQAKLRATLEGHDDTVRSVALSADDKTLASASGLVMLWDVARGKDTATLKDFHTQAVAFAPKGNLLAGGGRGNLTLWEVADGSARITKTLKPFQFDNWVHALTFSPDGKTLAVGCGKARAIGVALELRNTADLAPTFSETSLDPIMAVTFTPDSKHLATADFNNFSTGVRLWEVVPKKNGISLDVFPPRLKGDGWAAALAFSPDSKTLASAGAKKTIKIWEVASPKETAALSGHTDVVYALAFSPDGKWLASGSKDKTIRLWDVASGKTAAVLEGHASAIRALAVTRDGRLLVSGSEDKTIKLWEISSGKEKGPR